MEEDNCPKHVPGWRSAGEIPPEAGAASTGANGPGPKVGFVVKTSNDSVSGYGDGPVPAAWVPPSMASTTATAAIDRMAWECAGKQGKGSDEPTKRKR